MEVDGEITSLDDVVGFGHTVRRSRRLKSETKRDYAEPDDKPDDIPAKRRRRKRSSKSERREGKKMSLSAAVTDLGNAAHAKSALQISATKIEQPEKDDPHQESEALPPCIDTVMELGLEEPELRIDFHEEPAFQRASVDVDLQVKEITVPIDLLEPSIDKIQREPSIESPAATPVRARRSKKRGRPSNMRIPAPANTKIATEEKPEEKLVPNLSAVEAIIESDPLRINLPPCEYKDHSSSWNCEQNPNCLFGLGERKKGIWDDRLVSQLKKGSDPNNLCRDTGPNGPPAGLKNLGATCYINAFLQTLFSNPVARRLIYQWNLDPGSSDEHATKVKHEVMVEMQKVFALLQGSSHKSQSLDNFTKLLSIHTGVQQDAQEFNKLLLSYIDEVVASQQKSGLKKLTRLFEGKQEYVTKCCKCEEESRLEATFYELELQIAKSTKLNSANLEECVTLYGASENLEGKNMFHCSNCDEKCNAERKTNISALPDVLNLQLMRFVYDPKTFTKKKLKDQVYIPKELDFNTPELMNILSPKLQSQMELGDQTNKSQYRYRLTAVLNHRGSSANSGHYTADLCDRYRNGTWWSFDDEVTSSVENHDDRFASRNAYMLVYEKIKFSVVTDVSQSFPIELPRTLDELVRSTNNNIQAQCEAFKSRREAIDQAIEDRKNDYQRIFRKLNPFVKGPNNRNCVFVPTVWLKQWIQGVPIRSDSNVVLPIESTSIPFKDEPLVGEILCPHSDIERELYTLDPNRVAEMKRISKSAFHAILKSCNHSPEHVDSLLCKNTEICQQCLAHFKDSVESACHDEVANEKIHAILTKDVVLKSQIPSDEQGEFVFISRNWILQWKRYHQKQQLQANELLKGLQHGRPKTTRNQKAKSNFFEPKNSSVETGPDLNINKSIECEHGNLSLGMQGKRIIPKKDWEFLLENVMGGGCKEKTKTFSAFDSDCSVCIKSAAESRQLQQSVRVDKDAQLKDKEFGSTLRNLLRRKCGHPTIIGNTLQRGKYYLVPRSWMTLWRTYLSTSNGNLSPGPIREAVQISFFCPHAYSYLNTPGSEPTGDVPISDNDDARQSLVVHPQTLAWLFNSCSYDKSLIPIDDANDFTGEYTEILSEKEWQILSSLYPVQLGQALDTVEALLTVNEDVRLRDYDGDRENDVTFNPLLCKACMASRSTSLVKFEKAEISVKILPETDMLDGMTNILPPTFTLGEKTKRRSSRKRSSQTQTTLLLSSSNLVSELLVILWERGTLPADVRPSELVVLYQGKELDPSKTLEQSGVRAHELVSVQPIASRRQNNEFEATLPEQEWVSFVESTREGNPVLSVSCGEDDDVVCLDMRASTNGRQTETGFAGTVLARN